MRYALLLLLPLSLLLAGCPNDVDVEIPQMEPKLVVASQVIPNVLIAVNLSKTFGSLDFGAQDTNMTDSASQALLNSLFVNGAIVTVSYLDQIDTLLPIDTTSGTYVSLFTPAYINETYTLRAKDRKTGLEIIAQSTMLPAMSLTDVTHAIRFDTTRLQVAGAIDTMVIDTVTRFDFAFQDIPEAGFFMINVYKISTAGGGTSIGGGLFNGLTPGTGSAYEQTRLYTDALLTSGAVADSAVYSNLFGPGDTVAVSLSAISKPYYDFLVKRKKAGNLLQSFLNEPTNYPTNVEGGYGFFNITNPTVKTLILQ